VRRTRSAWLAVAALTTAVALAGCGGHSGDGASANQTTKPRTTAAPTTQSGPLRLVAVRPRTELSPMSPIRVRFASPLADNSPLPTLAPATPGTWARAGSSAVFTPSQAYPPDATIAIKVAKKPGGKREVVATRTTPHGSLERAQQILARLRYLPLTTTAAAPTTATEEASAVYAPPPGHFQWRYPATPSAIRKDWLAEKSHSGQVMRGAVIAFQYDHGLTIDASVGHDTWAALTRADLADKVDPNPYSYVHANLVVPQTLSVWVNGKTVLTSPVNGGVAGAPTPLGTFPVYERFTATTMSGTNPDGSTYSDPGVPWVNYFSGGSAVHGFPRASYGFPQSVGCLELPIPTAAKVYKLINYGTLVNVIGPYVPTSSASPAAPSPSSSPSTTPSPTHSSHPTHSPSHAPTPTATHSA
jgi:lipoprotein-anchoring transpeptidase ErfK/SrfK